LILREGKHGTGMEFIDIQHTAFGTRRLVRMHREDRILGRNDRNFHTLLMGRGGGSEV
jgi:hypothetical protein